MTVNLDFLNIPSNQQDLSGRTILLYTASLDSSKYNTLNLTPYLSNEEGYRARSYYTQILSAKYIISRFILRQVLSHHTQTPPSDLEFEINKYGKPYLKNNKRIQFNISHSKDILCIVVTEDKDIGVDIEFKDRTINTQELQSIVLSQKEIVYINSLKFQEEKLNFFYRIWTLKESTLKALGCGLSYPVNQINFIDEALKIKNSISINVEQAQCKVHLLTLNPLGISSTNYALSIASTSYIKRVQYCDLNAALEDLPAGIAEY